MADNYLEKHYDDYQRKKAAMSSAHRPSYLELRALRVAVFADTVACCSRGGYVNRFGDQITLPVLDGGSDGTCFYTQKEAFRVDDYPTLSLPTEISVVNVDCLQAAKYLLDHKYRPAVLNMANAFHPGGGVEGGSGAQEENLCRRSNLYRSIFPYGSEGARYGLSNPNQHYPLDSEGGGVYSPQVWVFKEGEDKRYAYLDTPYVISVITVAGVNRPALDADGKFLPQVADTVRHRIRTILRLGLKHGNDALVLGALGCGAFCNPPEQVALLFKELLLEPEFCNKYRRILFAIIDDKNAYQKHNPHGNFVPFKNVFK